MPELPDVVVYIEALEERILGSTLERVRLASPFLLRSIAPPIGAAEGRAVIGLRRIGKRIAIGFEGDLWLVLHLMIAGRLHWKAGRERNCRQAGAGAFRLHRRQPAADRSRVAAAGVAARGRGRRRAPRARSRGAGGARGGCRRISPPRSHRKITRSSGR